MCSDEHETTVIDRLGEVLGLTGIMQIAAFLGEKPSIVSDWKRWGRVPETERNKLAELGIRLDWVNTGEGKRYRV